MVKIPLMSIINKKSLIFQFSIANIKLRYRGTYIGIAWSALEPLLMFLLLFVVFSSIKETNREFFSVYLISGIMIYHIFIKGTMAGLASIRDNAGILKSLNIEKEFFPTVATGSTILLAAITVGVFFSLMPVFNFTPQWSILLLPIVLGILFLLIQGISYFLSVVNVYARDIQPIWAIFSYALIFVTPIFWYIEDVKGILPDIHMINPLGQIVELTHKIVFGEIPSIQDWAYVLLLTLSIFILGFVVFSLMEKRISEKL